MDEKLLQAVDEAAKPLRLKRSNVVRLALQDWLRKQAIERFEREWLKALQGRTDEAGRAEVWADAQTWSEP